MAKKRNIILGVLLFLISVAGVVYVSMPNEGISMNIDKLKSTFYITENNVKLVSGIEYSKLYNSSNKLVPVNRTTIDTTLTGKNTARIDRIDYYNNNITITNSYYFDGKITDITKFPLKHTIQINNANGYIYQYEIQKLNYTGIAKTKLVSPLHFGRKMTVEWLEKPFESSLSKTGTLKLRYKITDDNTILNIRLFDPTEYLILSGFDRNITAELGSSVEVNASVVSGDLFIDFTHPDYGYNYTTGTDSKIFNLTVEDFINDTFDYDGTNYTTTILTYNNKTNLTVYAHIHKYDYVSSLKFTIVGSNHNDSYPSNVKVYVNDTLSNSYLYTFTDSTQKVDTFNDSTSFKYRNLTANQSTLIGYFKVLKSVNVTDAYINVTGFGDVSDLWIEAGTVNAQKDWNYTGAYSDTETVNFTLPLNTYLATCVNVSEFCNVPLYAFSKTVGYINLTTIDIVSPTYITTVTISTSAISSYINRTASTGVINVPIKFESATAGNLTISSMEYRYLGGNKTYEITVHDDDYSVNLTKQITYYYSGWSSKFPPNIKGITFYPAKPTSQNVSPFGQTATYPILRINTTNYGGNMDMEFGTTNVSDCIYMFASNVNTKNLFGASPAIVISNTPAPVLWLKFDGSTSDTSPYRWAGTKYQSAIGSSPVLCTGKISYAYNFTYEVLS